MLEKVLKSGCRSFFFIAISLESQRLSRVDERKFWEALTATSLDSCSQGSFLSVGMIKVSKRPVRTFVDLSHNSLSGSNMTGKSEMEAESTTKMENITVPDAHLTLVDYCAANRAHEKKYRVREYAPRLTLIDKSRSTGQGFEAKEERGFPAC